MTTRRLTDLPQNLRALPETLDEIVELTEWQADVGARCEHATNAIETTDFDDLPDGAQQHMENVAWGYERVTKALTDAINDKLDLLARIRLQIETTIDDVGCPPWPK